MNESGNRDRLPPAIRRFVDYFGELGPRWGLPGDACRIHAFLYLTASPANAQSIGDVLGLQETAVADALAFLAEYRMVDRAGSDTWGTGGDPWDLLTAGLNERRRRELPIALATLRECQREARADSAVAPTAARQMAKIVELVESLAAIDAQAQRLSPRMMRGLVEVSGRAAQFMDQVFGPGRRGGR